MSGCFFLRHCVYCGLFGRVSLIQLRNGLRAMLISDSLINDDVDDDADDDMSDKSKRRKKRTARRDSSSADGVMQV